MLPEVCLEKELCVSNTWFKRDERKKVTFRMGENKTYIDFVLIRREHRRFLQNVEAISEEFQHMLVIADIDKKIRNAVRKTIIKRRRLSLLRDVKIMK